MQLFLHLWINHPVEDSPNVFHIGIVTDGDVFEMEQERRISLQQEAHHDVVVVLFLADEMNGDSRNDDHYSYFV